METGYIKLLEKGEEVTIKTEALKPSEFFQSKEGLWVSSDFKKNVVEKASSEVSPCEYEVLPWELLMDSPDKSIEAALPEEHLFSEDDVCAIVADLIQKQPKGKEGVLLANGYSNLFYTEAFVVSVSWSAGDGKWFVGTWDRFDGEWGAWDRVFAPATEPSDVQIQSLEHSGALALIIGNRGASREIEDTGVKRVFFDAETTDLEEGYLIEGAYTDAQGDIVVFRVKPPVPIALDAMAVHHITESMVLNQPSFQDHPAFKDITDILKDTVLVAHNAPFDVAVLEREGIHVPAFIDTQRIAKHLYPDASKYSLQFLRYYLAISMDEDCVPHAAECDVRVLMKVFEKMMQKVGEKYELDTDEACFDKIAELSLVPVLLTTCTFPKYKGMTWREVNRTDPDYIRFLLGKGYDDEDLNFTLRYWANIKST